MTTTRCSTCRHWDYSSAHESWRLLIEPDYQRHPVRSDEAEEEQLRALEEPYGICSAITLRPSEEDFTGDKPVLAFTLDASAYKADLFTHRDFSCAMYERHPLGHRLCPKCGCLPGEDTSACGECTPRRPV